MGKLNISFDVGYSSITDSLGPKKNLNIEKIIE